jgi:hypothetical protein
MPLDVVTHGVLKKLTQRVAVMIGQVSWLGR